MTVAYPNPEELSCHLHEIACPHAEPIAHPLDPLSVGETPRRWVQLLGQLVAGVNRCIEVHKPLELQILRVLAEEQCVNCRLEPREWLEPPGRSRTGAGRATRLSGLHRSRPAAGGIGGRARPPEVHYRLSETAHRNRGCRGPRRGGLRPCGKRALRCRVRARTTSRRRTPRAAASGG